MSASITDAWAEYRDSGHLDQASHRDLRIMKAAFHMGVVACLGVLVKEGQPLSDALVSRLLRESTLYTSGAE